MTHKMLYFLPYYGTMNEKLYGEGDKLKNILRVVFCILSCLCVASSVIFLLYLGVWWFIGDLALGLVSIVLMFALKGDIALFRKKTPKPDFMNTDEENEKIRNDDRSE